MVKRILVALLLAALTMSLNLPAVAARRSDPGAATADSLSGPMAGEIAEDDEIFETLADLDAAGLPLSEAEMAEINLARPLVPGSGRLGYRAGTGSGQEPASAARVVWSGEWGTLKGRWRTGERGSAAVQSALIAEIGSWRLAAGRLGMSHGFGLLAGAPGRTSSLTADGSLLPGSDRWLAWTGTPAAQALLGGGAQFRRGAWRGGVLVGQRPPGLSPPVHRSRPTTLVEAVWDSDGRQVSGLILTDPAEEGAGLCLRLQGGAWQSAAEVVARRPTAGGRAQVAALSAIGWRVHRGLKLEFLCGWAEPGLRPAMGQKNPVLGGWAGRGWALRTTWRAAKGLQARFLVQEGEGRSAEPGQPSATKELKELQLEMAWPAGWRGQARWRSTAVRMRAWSARFPWQPPVLQDLDEREVAGLGVSREGRFGRVQVKWRRLELGRLTLGGGWDGGGARSLISFGGIRPVSRSSTLRAEYGYAWGAPVDLVGAAVPFGGYVVPRHWGQWRSEWLVGGEVARGRWTVQGALSQRRKATPVQQGRPTVWGVWLQAGLNW